MSPPAVQWVQGRGRGRLGRPGACRGRRRHLDLHGRRLRAFGSRLPPPQSLPPGRKRAHEGTARASGRVTARRAGEERHPRAPSTPETPGGRGGPERFRSDGPEGADPKRPQKVTGLCVGQRPRPALGSSRRPGAANRDGRKRRITPYVEKWEGRSCRSGGTGPCGRRSAAGVTSLMVDVEDRDVCSLLTSFESSRRLRDRRDTFWAFAHPFSVPSTDENHPQN